MDSFFHVFGQRPLPFVHIAINPNETTKVGLCTKSSKEPCLWHTHTQSEWDATNTKKYMCSIKAINTRTHTMNKTVNKKEQQEKTKRRTNKQAGGSRAKKMSARSNIFPYVNCINEWLVRFYFIWLGNWNFRESYALSVPTNVHICMTSWKFAWRKWCSSNIQLSIMSYKVNIPTEKFELRRIM